MTEVPLGMNTSIYNSNDTTPKINSLKFRRTTSVSQLCPTTAQSQK